MSLIQAFRVRTAENVTAGSTAANSTNTATNGDLVVRVVSNDNPFRVRVAPSATAVSTDSLVPPGVVEYFLCTPGSRVSVIREGSSDASVSVAFLTR